MNRIELVSEMAEKTGLSKKDVESILSAFVDSVKGALGKHDKVSLKGFGTFESTKRAARKVYKNPRSKELGTKMTEEKYAPVFHAGKDFKDSVK